MSHKFSITHRLKSFIYAFYGLRHTLLTQHNFIIHIVLAIAAIVLGFYLNINSMEWVAIIIVIGLVLSAEVFNTAIEELVNLVSPQKNKKAGIIKDVAAGAVLIIAMAALITGIIIFIPKIIDLL
ncbi:MAG: diacylglycerol kinase family protein [Bacteroidota bacterium]